MTTGKRAVLPPSTRPAETGPELLGESSWQPCQTKPNQTTIASTPYRHIRNEELVFDIISLAGLVHMDSPGAGGPDG